VLLPPDGQAVRRDPAERAALQARLAGYEAQEAPLREAREALLAANKQQAGSLTAEVKLAALQERRAKEEERLMLVGGVLRLCKVCRTGPRGSSCTQWMQSYADGV
jgi:hypothetical protein